MTTTGTLEVGDWVMWRHVSRKGYGYVCHVPGQVVRVTAKRIRIRVKRTTGEEVERLVTRDSLRWLPVKPN